MKAKKAAAWVSTLSDFNSDWSGKLDKTYWAKRAEVKKSFDAAAKIAINDATGSYVSPLATANEGFKKSTVSSWNDKKIVCYTL